MATTAQSVADICLAAKRAAGALGALDSATKDRALHAIADALEARAPEILEANARDMEAGREAGLDAAAEGWDLVVSNPPYVESLESLQPELRFEPERALIGSGMHEEIARAAKTRFLVFEVGDGQASEVAAILDAAGYADVIISRDLSGNERVVEGRR